MNIVLDDSVEIDSKKNIRSEVGRILLKGDAITLIQYVFNIFLLMFNKNLTSIFVSVNGGEFINIVGFRMLLINFGFNGAFLHTFTKSRKFIICPHRFILDIEKGKTNSHKQYLTLSSSFPFLLSLSSRC
jgi:hypothetical protein